MLVLGQVGQYSFQKRATEGEVHSGITILVVDDNYRYLSQIQRVLGRVCPKARLFEADSIILAVRLAEQVQPNLVFLDVVLGEEDGIRCARRIKAVSGESRIIMISAYPDREFHRLSLESGAVAFLDKKDLDVTTLRHVIDDLL
jgi:DNA-binding response OmpR family regulator